MKKMVKKVLLKNIIEKNYIEELIYFFKRTLML